MVLLKIALLATAIWIVAVWVSILVYVAVSYVAAARHIAPRPLSKTIAWAVRETLTCFWVEPLMLLFEPFGEHLGTGGGDVPIVLVHGYFQNRVDFIYLARRLRESGSGPLYACNFFWPQKLESSSEFVRSFVEHVREETGAPVVDLLTHSTGGLFALDLLRDEPTVVRRAALIALPAGGVPWRGPLIGTSGRQLRADSSYHAERRMEIDERPVLSIYSAHDNVVHPVETSQLSGSKAVNLEIEGPGHLSVLFDRRVAQAACSFLLAPTDEDALRNARDAVREQRRCGTVYQAHH